MIYEKVKNIQSATIIRNAVNVNKYPITECDDLRVAVVGPFLPGTQNYDALELLHYCVKNLPTIHFDFIGDVSDDFKNSLNFSNVNFLGRVENYIESLSNCNVLLSPYASTSLNSILLSGLLFLSFSIFNISLALTLYCFPPVCITAKDIINP